MDAQMKIVCIFGFIIIASYAVLESVDAAGECGSASADRMAFRLAPCLGPARDPNAEVSASCCSTVHTMGQNPNCLCAVLQSNTAKFAGVKPEVAITIPKRCNLADRPVGYKCGVYTLP